MLQKQKDVYFPEDIYKDCSSIEEMRRWCRLRLRERHNLRRRGRIVQDRYSYWYSRCLVHQMVSTSFPNHKVGNPYCTAWRF